MKNQFRVGIVTLLIAACVAAAPASARKSPVKNTAAVYTATNTGGTYTIPTPKSGFYQLSYIANFHPQSNVIFACRLLLNGSIRSMSTTPSPFMEGFNPGVNGLLTVQIFAGDIIKVLCGPNTGDAFTWGEVPLAVTVLRIDDVNNLTIP
jgi:hypothetical protein